MESEDINRDVVHPEVRAHINSLVSAVSSAMRPTEQRKALTMAVFAARRIQRRRRWQIYPG